MTEKSASSLGRMLDVLDLFDDTMLARTTDDIASALDVSLPTAYRYVRLLVEAGLLQRAEDSHYTLGPRIIVLDHYIRKADPVLREGIPIMRELVQATGFDCVASGLFGDQVLDTHRELGGVPANLAYGRGRPRPLFQGAAPKVILAQFATPQLHKLFDARHDDIVKAGLPDPWPAFRRHFAAIRNAGFYLSIGELEPQLAAVAAPVTKAGGGARGAISLVLDVQRLSIVDTDKLTALVAQAARRISDRLG